MHGKWSAGLLLFREVCGALEVLLVHPGGAFWVGKDGGAWSIPKGEFAEGDEPLEVARREFEEETSVAPPVAEFFSLRPVRQPSGKVVHAWAVRGELDVAALRSNLCSAGSARRSG